MTTTVVVSTIGAPFAITSLDSMPRWDEVLVVIDLVGRESSLLESTYPLQRFEADVKARGATPIRYDPSAGTWAVMNGCFNVGARAARNAWVLFTHDDVTWPPYDYPRATNTATAWIAARGASHDAPIVGIALPDWEVEHQVIVPTFAPGAPALTQCVTPVSQILSRARLADIGYFDEEFGVWYDAQLAEECMLRNWWFLHLSTPPVWHMSNSTYRLNDWGARWRANPKWGAFQENFVRKYGKPHTRVLADQSIPVDFVLPT